MTVDTRQSISLENALEPAAQLAALARALERAGYADQIAGHITYSSGDGTLLSTPWELFWHEMKASDMVRIDMNGEVIEGTHKVTPAISLHLEIHKRRPDVKIAVHNHPDYATIWAAVQEIPPPYDQTAAMVLDDEMVVYAEYEGNVSSAVLAAQNVAAMGDHKTIALLANHGVLVFAKSFQHAYLKSIALERRAKLAWQVHALGEGVGKPMNSAAAEQMGRMMSDREVPWPHLWEAVLRREIRLDPSVVE